MLSVQITDTFSVFIMEEYIHNSGRDVDIINYNNRQYLRNLHIPDILKDKINNDSLTTFAPMPTLRYKRLLYLLKQRWRRSNNIHIVYSVSKSESSSVGEVNMNYAHSIGLKLGIVHPSMISKDGEYRTGLFDIDGILLFAENYSELYNKLDGYIRTQIVDKNWLISYRLYGYNQNDKKYKEMKQLKREISNRSIEITLLICAWFIYIKRNVENTYITNINDDIHKIFGGEEDIKFYKELVKDYPKELAILYNLCILYHENYKMSKKHIEQLPAQTIQYGIKLIPLKYDEVGKIDNFSSKVWRELAINRACTDLVINGICGGLPMAGEWYYIHHTDEYLYDNPNIHIKIKDSTKAKKVLVDIYKAQNQLGTSTDDEVLSNVQRYLNSPIETVKEQLSISENAICLISEDVGRTFMNHFWIRNNIWGYYRVGDMFGNLDLFKKYIFEWIYTLLCINENIGVFQGDLHLNNITLNHITFDPVMRGHLDGINPLSAFNVGDETVILTPFIPDRATIIDFSRGVVNTSSSIFKKSHKSMFEPASGGALGVEEPLGEASIASILLDDSMESILNKLKPEYTEQIIFEQIPHLLRMLERHFPSFYSKNSTTLQTVLENRFDQAWQILCGTDIYTLSLYMAELFKVEYKKNTVESRPLKELEPIIWKNLIDWLTKINTFMGEYIITNLTKLIQNKVDIGHKFPNPNLQCIKHMYKDWVVGDGCKWTFDNNPSGDKVNKVLEYFNVNAPMIYGTSGDIHLPQYMLEPKKLMPNGIVAPNTLYKKFDPMDCTRYKQELVAEHLRISEVGKSDIDYDMFKYMDYFVEHILGE